ncbi:hypothetical protein HZS_5759 [Henneguya salminicola]|nr:hypothetical protein HZS_5759 [Henneguya salminicola]
MLKKHIYKIPGKLIASICELNQWALDFKGNYKRICESISISKSKGATYRLGPELEISGYNCQDHFNEIDTIIHGYEVLAKILANLDFHGIVLDIGLPIIHDGVKYNSRAICYNGDLICIRPKTVLANDGMYHEERWFVGWKKTVMGDWLVPKVIFKVINKVTVPIGVCVLQFKDVCIGIEMCEELFVPNSMHNLLSMNGAHVICNGNGSHFQIGKINKRFSLVADASGKTGCTYLYGNLQGCDGSTMYFDGGSFVASSGKVVSMCKRFSINSGCVVMIVVVDVNEIRSRRASVVSLCKTAAEAAILPKIIIPENICKDFDHEYDDSEMMDPYNVINHNNIEIDELIGAPSCYMWDYLRRSRMGGFFVPLSGGADSSVVAILVYYMAYNVCESIKNSDEKERNKLLQIIREIVRDEFFYPKHPKDITERILFTAYMGSSNSSSITKDRSKKLANFINSNHIEMDISGIYNSFVDAISTAFFVPKFKMDGGSPQEDITLQNIQSRSRLILSYTISQLAPLSSSRTHPSSPLLVLGTSNADETIAGYFTKYDSSSADISPIASLGKHHINKILNHFAIFFNTDILKEISEATPTAELVPMVNGQIIQKDEEDIGFTYTELTRFREIRSTLFCGPLSMFNVLLDEWSRMSRKNPSALTIVDPKDIAVKVKKFFTKYAANRHKTVILAPAIYLCNTSLDGRYYDMRPVLYNVLWTWQFKCIDRWLEYRQNIKK